MKRALAAVVTAAVLGLALWSGRGDLSSTSRAALATPEDCIREMFRAAAEGDVPAYLKCFAGAERARLERELDAQTAETFAESLAGAVASLKGWAMLEDGSGDTAADRVARTVDRVYAGRTERQTYRLERGATGRWRITRVELPTPFQPATPYGTPVYQAEPAP